MNKAQRILGIFAASVALGLGMGGCEGKTHGTQQKTPQGTKVTVYKEAHIVRERIGHDLIIGADFKQNLYFKVIVAGGSVNTDAEAGTQSSISIPIQIPFADIKDQETLDKIAYLRTFYEQAMLAKKPEVGPAPVAAPAPVAPK